MYYVGVGNPSDSQKFDFQNKTKKKTHRYQEFSNKSKHQNIFQIFQSRKRKNHFSRGC